MITTLSLIAPHAKLTHTSREIEVYAPVPCPSCGYELEWAVRTPPIPLTLFHWFDPNGEGAHIEDCPRCGEPLTDGDLTKEAPTNTTGPAASLLEDRGDRARGDEST